MTSLWLSARLMIERPQSGHGSEELAQPKEGAVIDTVVELQGAIAVVAEIDVLVSGSEPVGCGLPSPQIGNPLVSGHRVSAILLAMAGARAMSTCHDH